MQQQAVAQQAKYSGVVTCFHRPSDGVVRACCSVCFVWLRAKHKIAFPYNVQLSVSWFWVAIAMSILVLFLGWLSLLWLVVVKLRPPPLIVPKETHADHFSDHDIHQHLNDRRAQSLPVLSPSSSPGMASLVLINNMDPVHAAAGQFPVEINGIPIPNGLSQNQCVQVSVPAGPVRITTFDQGMLLQPLKQHPETLELVAEAEKKYYYKLVLRFWDPSAHFARPTVKFEPIEEAKIEVMETVPCRRYFVVEQDGTMTERIRN